MNIYKSFLTGLAAFAFAFAGCNGTEPEIESEPELEQVSPEADVEITPGGGAEVELAPEITEESGTEPAGTEATGAEEPETVEEVEQ